MIRVIKNDEKTFIDGLQTGMGRITYTQGLKQIQNHVKNVNVVICLDLKRD